MAAPSEETTISQATTLDTLVTLATISAAGRYHFVPRVPSAAVAADIFEFSLWEKVGSGDTSAKVHSVTVAGTGALQPVDLGVWAVVTEMILKVNQTDGTTRTIIGSVKDVG